jgi:cellulose synthase/poly-beta-1,6-N-acetylglucosamine synthase-like glycosyltransferase
LFKKYKHIKLIFIYGFLLLVFGLYVIFLIFLYYGWLKIRQNILITQPKNTFATIIICVRNEEENILKLLQCIENQSYRKDLFEVIIIDDDSADCTFDLMQSKQKSLTFSLSLHRLLNFFKDDLNFQPIASPKKRAITEAIKLAKGNLIVSTDGDCLFGEDWLKTIVRYYESTSYKFISGPVTFHHNGFFDRLQIVEFASLVGSGAASIQLKMPNMCNGANIAYEKQAFEAVNGFEGFDDIPSGDDEFLMHKIANKFPNQIGFLKDKRAIVSTHAQLNLASFLQQRKRWASKWNKYIDWKNTILALFIFILNFSVILVFGMLLLGYFNNLLITVFCMKLVFEWLFLGNVLAFLNKKNELILLPIVQILYPFYVVFTALNSFKKSYSWKGRNY